MLLLPGNVPGESNKGKIKYNKKGVVSGGKRTPMKQRPLNVLLILLHRAVP